MENTRGAEILHWALLMAGMCTWKHPPSPRSWAPPGPPCSQLNTFLRCLINKINTCEIPKSLLLYLMLSSTCQEQSTGWIFSPQSLMVLKSKSIQGKDLWSAQGWHCLQGQRHCHSSQDRDQRRDTDCLKTSPACFFFPLQGFLN